MSFQLSIQPQNHTRAWKSSVLIFHPDHRIFCQSRLVMPRFLPLEMNFKVSPCLNKQIYLATLAELANDTSDSVIPMILQPSHKGWHQKLFSLSITFYKVKIKLYPGSVRVPRDGMNALGNRRSHNSGRICNLDSHLAHIMEGTCAEELRNVIKTIKDINILKTSISSSSSLPVQEDNILF